VRKSTKKQEEATQVDSIAAWLAGKAKDIKEVQAFEDTGSRHKAHKRADFQRLLKWVEAGEVQWVVVAELDRFGSADPYQLMSFIHQLREAGCKLWVAADSKCVSEGDDLTILTNVFKGITSEKEQYTRSARALRTFPDLAARGEFTGGRVPFALDVECRRGDKVVWHFTPEQGGGIFCRNGKEERLTKLPVHDHRVGERTYLVPSIRKDRIEALGLIFDTFATEAVSYSSLARRLNDRKVTAGHYDKWTHDRILYILSNPVYSLGYRPVGRTTQSQFHRHEVSEHGVRTLALAPDKAGKKVARPESEWIAPPVPNFEPLIDPETFAKVKVKIENQKVVRAPRSDRHWLSGIVVCDKCGQRMYCWNQAKSTRDGEKFITAYRCRTADRECQGKDENKSKCQRHIVKHEVLVPYVEEFLRNRGKSLEETISAKGDRRHFEQLSKQETDAGRLLNDINESLYFTVYDYIEEHGKLAYRDDRGEHTAEVRDVFDYPMEFALDVFRNMFEREPSEAFGDRVEGETVCTPGDVKLIFVDGEMEGVWWIDQLYEQIHALSITKQMKEIEDKEREFEALIENFGKLTNARALNVANAKVEALDREIKVLRSRLDNLAEKRGSTADKYQALSDRVKDARVAMEVGSDSQKADAARRLFKEIRLSFTYTKHNVTTRSHLAKIEILPLLGDPAIVEVDSRGSAWRGSGRRRRG
jgi:hypothetical protein